MADKDRYWAYVDTEEDGDITEDLGDFDDLNPAITKACDTISLMVTDDMMASTVRIVDKKSHHSTVWQAGPTEAYKLWARQEKAEEEVVDDL